MRALVCGAGGFIGRHLSKYLSEKGYIVLGVDLHKPLFDEFTEGEFIVSDLRDSRTWKDIEYFSPTHIFQLAADMGGAEYVFSGNYDYDIMSNSAQINLQCCEYLKRNAYVKLFYASSACIYPEYNQVNALAPVTEEASAYPAAPDSEYGWEKLFSERLFLSLRRNKGVDVKIGRFHNVFGPLGTYEGGREKAPAAVCRKVCQAKRQGSQSITIFGSGEQTRSFLYVSEAVEGVVRLMQSDFSGPYNIGSEEMVSINSLVSMVCSIADYYPEVVHVDGPTGVAGRNSDNRLIRTDLGWAPTAPLAEGLGKTYNWISSRIV